MSGSDADHKGVTIMSIVRAFVFGLLPVLMCLATVGPANAEVTVLQNGVSPTPQYEGSTDTWISDEQWERNRNNAASPTMSMGG